MTRIFVHQVSMDMFADMFLTYTATRVREGWAVSHIPPQFRYTTKIPTLRHSEATLEF